MEENRNCNDMENQIANNSESRAEMPIVNIFGQVVNENTFALGQKIMPGFTFDTTLNYEAYERLKCAKARGEGLSVYEESQLIFPLIFGSFECERNLSEAKNLTCTLLDKVNAAKPVDNFTRQSHEYMMWLQDYAMPQILLGTIYAYHKEYIKASYHFMLGLKTEQIVLNMPYCDFIRYVLGKLKLMDCSYTVGEGCGFSPDNPMGSYYNGDFLLASKAMHIISEMEGDNGEIVIAKQGRKGLFGYLECKGAVTSKTTRNMVDIYDTFIIDRGYSLKKLRLYFNGYFSSGKILIKLPARFHIKSHSDLLNHLDFKSD